MFLTEKKSSVQGILLLANGAFRPGMPRRATAGGPGSRNEPSWETGERGSDVVLLLFATGRFSLPEARERKKASKRTRDAPGTFALLALPHRHDAPASFLKVPVRHRRCGI